MRAAEFDEGAYKEAFARLNHHKPYKYQTSVAKALWSGENIFLRAPTGSGKTQAVLTPFVVGWRDRWPNRPTRLIYALPLRSLVQQIGDEARILLSCLGETVTVQTGEQPDDEFFDRGRVIVTTYDQVLSGLLCAPYGLSRRQANINAAAVAGALVVFDEFHLMGLDTALLTGAATLRLFDGFARSVWMTATATEAPAALLASAIGCERIALSTKEMNALPVVKTSTRDVSYEAAPLDAAAITAAAPSRTIAIVNQVERAQQLFSALKPWADTEGIPCRLLHARFFKPDRDARVTELRDLFGPEASRPAILVATQVVEAGVDISCEHLFTELCPMNALLQRAGRCARFKNQRGLVHVHPLPDEPRAWLPYGTLANNGADPALDATAAVLREQPTHRMSPDLAERWVERVHGPTDAQMLAGGYQRRLDITLGLIRRHASGVDPVRVSEYIREEDGATIRLIVASESDLPDRPALREAVSVSRYGVQELLRDDASIGWYWDLKADDPIWQPLATRQELRDAYIVALPPEIARYTPDEGLRLGDSGAVTSPPRDPPRRRGHRPLRWEPWGAHTLGVVDAAERRWSEDGGADGLMALGATRRFGLPAEALGEAGRVCSLIHDLGKLQERWQAWAEAYQRDRDSSWQHTPLAHTDYDPSKIEDRARDRRIRPTRGPHAAQSAWMALPLLADLLSSIPHSARAVVASACLAAVTSHHGSWVPPLGGELQIDEPVAGWEQVVAETLGVEPAKVRLAPGPDRRGRLAKGLDGTMHATNLESCWALTAYLTRLLRLSDQRATAEGGWGD